MQSQVFIGINHFNTNIIPNIIPFLLNVKIRREKVS